MTKNTRSPESSLILLRHRVSGETLNFDREEFENDNLAASGYNEDDWLTSEQYHAMEEEAADSVEEDKETPKELAARLAAEKKALAAEEKAAAEKAAAEKAK